MTEKTLTTENIKPALDALRGELAPWPVVAKKQDRLNTAQLNAANSGITSSLVAQIIANTAAIRALESAITGTGLRALVVASLPAVGTTGILYIVPVTTYDPDTDADVVNYSNEYIWIPVEGGTASEGHYEQVGQTGIVINNGQLTITVNGTSVGTFTANQSGDTTAAITVPTNADYVDRTTDQTVAGVKTFSSTINGTAAKAIADEDGTSIKTGYGKLAGNNTWTGTNTFSKDKLGTQTAYTLGTLPQAEDVQALLSGRTTDNNFVTSIYFYQSPIKGTGFRLTIRNKWDNSGYSTTGTTRNAHFEFLQNIDKTAYIQWQGYVNNSLYPLINNTYSLGSSSYQWSSVYAQTYYYNGTAWGLDKANEWTATNNFSTLSVFSNSVTYNEAPSSNVELPSIRIFGGGRYAGAFDYVWRSTGENVIRLSLGSYKSDGTFGYWSCNFGVPRDFSDGGKFGTPAFYPNNNNSYNLGSSTNQWSSVYAQTYYYNGTEFSSKFVTTDTQQVITGFKIFNTGSWIRTPQTIDPTTDPSSFISGNGIAIWDNANYWGGIEPHWTTDGTFRFVFGVSCFSTSETRPWSALSIDATKNNQALNLVPHHNNANLGTSTNKWKTLNGVNPGALSLPQVVTTFEDLTGYVLDGVTENQFPISGSIALDGWLQCRVTHTLGVASFLRMETSYRVWTASDKDCIEEYVLWVPVRAGMSFNKVVCKADDLKIRFHPMTGNV